MSIALVSDMSILMFNKNRLSYMMISFYIIKHEEINLYWTDSH